MTDGSIDRITSDMGYHPFVDHIENCGVDALPAALREALLPVEVAFDDDARPGLSAQITWVDDWWFSMVEGRGIAHIRGDQAKLSSAYVLLAIAFSGQNRLNGALRRFAVRSGEMILMPWTAAGGFVSAGNFHYLNVHIPKACLGKDSDDWTHMAFGLAISALTGPGLVLSSAIRTIALEAKREARHVALSLALPGIAQMVAEIFRNTEFIEAEPDHAGDQTGRVVSYLKIHHASAKLSAAQVAVDCGMSVRQLFRSFSRDGKTFAQTLREIRLAKARELLTGDTELSVKEIAIACGFSSPGHFCRNFRAALNTSPLRYRRHEIAGRTTSLAPLPSTA